MAGVVTLIKDDHQKLEQVFKKLGGSGGDTKQLLQQVAELLIPHSKAEEEIVYPAIKRIVPSETEDVDDGLAEHRHVEEEEQDILPKVAKAASNRQLSELGEQLEAHKVQTLAAMG